MCKPLHAGAIISVPIPLLYFLVTNVACAAECVWPVLVLESFPELPRLVAGAESMSEAEAIGWCKQAPYMTAEQFGKLQTIQRTERDKLAVIDAKFAAEHGHAPSNRSSADPPEEQKILSAYRRIVPHDTFEENRSFYGYCIENDLRDHILCSATKIVVRNEIGRVASQTPKELSRWMEFYDYYCRDTAKAYGYNAEDDPRNSGTCKVSVEILNGLAATDGDWPYTDRDDIGQVSYVYANCLKYNMKTRTCQEVRDRYATLFTARKVAICFARYGTPIACDQYFHDSENAVLASLTCDVAIDMFFDGTINFHSLTVQLLGSGLGSSDSEALRAIGRGLEIGLMLNDVSSLQSCLQYPVPDSREEVMGK